jgi:hypothetical protein
MRLFLLLVADDLKNNILYYKKNDKVALELVIKLPATYFQLQKPMQGISAPHMSLCKAFPINFIISSLMQLVVIHGSEYLHRENIRNTKASQAIHLFF